MNAYVVSVILAFSAGIFAAMQGAMNAQLGKFSGQYAMIIGVSLAQALIASIILLRSGWSAFGMISSPWILVAGACGVAIMFGVSSSIPSLGALSVFVLVVLGQVIGSAIIDHVGAFGATRIPITPQKIGSIAVILLGVYWLMKSS